MPYILEHELAHVQRNDNRNQLIAGSTGVGVAVLCTSLLPAAQAAAALAGLAMANLAYRWWAELACDRAALLYCGRRTAVTCWREEVDRARLAPLAPRLFLAFLALRGHPPLRLRLSRLRF